MPLIDATGDVVGTHREAVALTALFDEVSHINQTTNINILQLSNAPPTNTLGPQKPQITQYYIIHSEQKVAHHRQKRIERKYQQQEPLTVTEDPASQRQAQFYQKVFHSDTPQPAKVKQNKPQQQQ